MEEGEEAKPSHLPTNNNSKSKAQFVPEDMTKSPADRKSLSDRLRESASFQPLQEEKSHPLLQPFPFGNISRLKGGGNQR